MGFNAFAQRCQNHQQTQQPLPLGPTESLHALSLDLTAPNQTAIRPAIRTAIRTGELAKENRTGTHECALGGF
jgi:hypothetical protein